MTETELLAKIGTEGWTIIESRAMGQEGSGTNLLTVKALKITKPQGLRLACMWVSYYMKVDGTCYWRETDPFPEVTTYFGDEVRAKIASLVAAGTIKAGYIERVDEVSQTALVAAIKMNDTTALYHVYKVAGVLNVTPLTGTYPI